MVLRTRVVSAGVVAQTTHFPAVDRNPKTELVDIADVDRDSPVSAPTEYGTAADTETDSMFADTDPQ